MRTTTAANVSEEQHRRANKLRAEPVIHDGAGSMKKP
jgi:hypothetical protein